MKGNSILLMPGKKKTENLGFVRFVSSLAAKFLDFIQFVSARTTTTSVRQLFECNFGGEQTL